MISTPAQLNQPSLLCNEMCKLDSPAYIVTYVMRHTRHICHETYTPTSTNKRIHANTRAHINIHREAYMSTRMHARQAFFKTRSRGDPNPRSLSEPLPRSLSDPLPVEEWGVALSLGRSLENGRNSSPVESEEPWLDWTKCRVCAIGNWTPKICLASLRKGCLILLGFRNERLWGGAVT